MAIPDVLSSVRKKAVERAASMLLPLPVRTAVNAARMVLPDRTERQIKNSVLGSVQKAAPVVRRGAEQVIRMSQAPERKRIQEQQAFLQNRPNTVANRILAQRQVRAPLGTHFGGGFQNALIKKGAEELLIKPSARALTTLGLTGADLYTGRENRIPNSPSTRDLFGRSGYVGEGGAAQGLTPLFRDISKGRGDLGSISRFGQEKLGINPMLSAPLIGLGAVALDANPLPDPKDAGKGIKKAVEVSDEVADALKYVRELKGAREAARAGKPQTIAERMVNLYKDAKNSLVDSAAPIKDALRKAESQGGFQITPNRDVRRQISRVRRAEPIASMFMERNGLNNIIQKVDDVEEFGQYLIARQAKDVADQGIETGRDLARDANLVKVLANKYEPFAQEIQQYTNKLLDYTTESGLITRELADGLKKKYGNYVPLNRVFSAIEEQIPNVVAPRAIANLGKQGVVQKLKGSVRQIENPLGSLIEKTYLAVKQGEVNKAAQMLADSVNLPGNPLGLSKVETGSGGTDTFKVLRNGAVETWKTADSAIAEAARNLDEEQVTTFLKILAFPTRIFKAGTTGLNIPFILANSVKDTWTAFSFSPSAKDTVMNPVNFTKALFSALRHDELYKEALENAALITSFDISRAPGYESVDKIRAGRDILSQASYTIRNPGHWLRIVEDVIGRSEEFPRLLQYQGIKQKALREGASLENAKLFGADAARSTTADFAEGGSWKKVTGAILPYFNASVQGGRTLIRSMRERPAATTAKVVTSLFVPVAAATAWNMATPERKRIYDDIQPYEKENNLIIIPPNVGVDEEGRYKVIKIPLPAGLGQLATPVRRVVEGAAGSDPARFGDFAQGFIGAVSPLAIDTAPNRSIPQRIGKTVNSLLPQGLRPSAEGAANTNFFTGIPIESDYEKKLPVDQRFRDNTSGTARLLGGALKASPLKTEAFIKSTFGQVGSQALNLSDVALANLGVIPKDQIGGESIAQNIQRRFNRAAGGLQEQTDASELRKLVEKQEGDRVELRRKAEKLDLELTKLSPEEANARYTQIAETDPTLRQKLDDVIEERKLGLTVSEKLMRQLGVTNGERANYVYKELEKVEDIEERRAYWDELVAKKVITDSVAKQLYELYGK